MTAPGCLYALLIVLGCAVGGIVAVAFGWTPLAIVLGVVAVFFVTLALTYVIPAATKETSR
jgi:hypothetical protein